MKIKIKNTAIDVEIASDNSSRALGLMNRVMLPENDGMLFVFPDSEYRSFWMKNTYIPLSIAYIDKDNRIIEIKDMIPHNLSSVPSTSPAVYALEMNVGWFERNNIMAGDEVSGISQLQCESKKTISARPENIKRLSRGVIREIIKELISKPILIPPPPKDEDRISELPKIQHQKKNPKNPPELQGVLDSDMGELFDAVIKINGHKSHKELIEKLKKEVKPVIKHHKDYFDSARPLELASSLGLEFQADDLASAQTPSYPSGHTTQAFYIAHKLSEIFLELSSDFYKVAEMVASSRIDRGVHFFSDNEAGKILALKLASDGISKEL